MPTDEELQDLLRQSLDDAPLEPSAERIAALRARAADARSGQVATAPTSVTAPTAPDEQRWRPALWAAVAACIVALVAGFGVARVLDRDDASVAGEVEFEGQMQGADQQDAAAQLLVVKTGIGRIIDLDTRVLPILPVSEFYEVWFVAPDDSPERPNRISAGTFHPDPEGRSNVRFAAAVDPAKYPTVEITAEPGDGNPAATGPVVLRRVIS